MSKPTLKSTTNYGMFVAHENNRGLQPPKHKVLEESMRKHGFIPAFPVMTTELPNGKLKIVAGHHRHAIAQTLSLPVWYVVVENEVDIFELESSTAQQWDLEDFAIARAAAGNESAALAARLSRDTGINMGFMLAALAGENTTGNVSKRIKSGSYHGAYVAETHVLLSYIKRLRDAIGDVARKTSFCWAISACMKTPGVNMEQLIHKIEINQSKLRPFSTRNDCLSVLEEIYNQKARERFSLRFCVLEEMRRRNATTKHTSEETAEATK